MNFKWFNNDGSVCKLNVLLNTIKFWVDINANIFLAGGYLTWKEAKQDINECVDIAHKKLIKKN